MLADEARATARQLERDPQGPLAGVPIAIKDHVWMRGAPATNGSLALRDFYPDVDAVCVERLRDAGAVIVGKTNNPEFCYRGITDNAVYGLTRNPRNLERTPGGSSGGSAAAVAADMVPFALGTDGGGSIRIPASFCGIAGLKPTFGLVPKLPGFRGWPTLSVDGPLARTVRDLALTLQVMAGASPLDDLTWPVALQRARSAPRGVLARTSASRPSSRRSGRPSTTPSQGSTGTSRRPTRRRSRRPPCGTRSPSPRATRPRARCSPSTSIR